MLEITDLTESEELALLGLLKAVIQVDKKLGPEEHQELTTVANKLGMKRFQKGVEKARDTFKTLAQIKAHALTVERQPARQLIFNVLLEMAKQDELLPEEQNLLGWLAEKWGVEYFRQ